MTLTTLNNLPEPVLREQLHNCCGSNTWVKKMLAVFPMETEQSLFQQAEKAWFSCEEADWLEAFRHHPKIGDVQSLREKFAATAAWAEGEQATIKHTTGDVIEALAEGNKQYEEKFGFIFIVCATGKPAVEMLNLLKERLSNNRETEIHIAMKEQLKITLLRLNKLLSP
jgi:2-oxo-4-hydroxy-4-carboxy-5-ureidoimidazoline decarboxylase